MFVAIAYAADAAAAQPGQSPFGIFVPMIIIFAIFYFILIRPQQKKAKEHTKTLESMKTGDEVITNGGIFGTVTRVEDSGTVIVEIADKVKVRVLKSQLHLQSEQKKVEEKKDTKKDSKKDEKK